MHILDREPQSAVIDFLRLESVLKILLVEVQGARAPVLRSWRHLWKHKTISLYRYFYKS